MNEIKSFIPIAPPEARSERAGAPAKKDNPAELKKALTEFESIFINQMLKSMRETVMKSELFHGGSAEDIYTSLFDMELSKMMASRGGIGLEEAFIRQLTDQASGVTPQEQPSRQAKPGEPAPLADYSPAGHPNQAAPVAAPVEKAADGEDHKEEGGIFKFPLRGWISSKFGVRKDPFTGHAKFHHGMDIAANEGSPIYPAASGKVIFSGKKAGYGNVVEVLHDNGYVTRYGHNSKNLAKQGDTVNISEPIAYVGSTGRSTGPHMHFEVMKDGAKIDPGKLFYG